MRKSCGQSLNNVSYSRSFIKRYGCGLSAIGTKSIENLISLSSDNPGSSSRQHQETQMFLELFISLLCISLININYPWQPIFNNFLVPRPVVNLCGTQPWFPRKHKSDYPVSQPSLPCYMILKWHDWRTTNLHSKTFKLYTNTTSVSAWWLDDGCVPTAKGNPS